MPRVSLPAAPASERKHGVCATNLSGKRGRVQDLVAHQVGDRHFGGRNQKIPRIAAHGEQILLEFRQLAGADERRGMHQIGYVRFAVSRARARADRA